MKIEDFLTEQWMNEYESKAVYNLTDTSCKAMDWSELYALAKEDLKDVKLDYGSIPGDPGLRREVLSLYQDQREETLTFSQGALNGAELVMKMLLKPGDHVITLTPGYQQYASLPKWLGCTVSKIALDEKDWSFSLEDFAGAIRPETRLFVFANPSNPTGTYLKKEQLEALCALCRKHNIWILCDEVYRFPSPDSPSVSDLYEKGVSVSSLSKLFGLAGLRLGWIKGNPEVIRAVDVYRDYSFISTGPLIDTLACAALKNKEKLMERSLAVIEANKKTIAAFLNKSAWFDCILPERGTVAFLHYRAPAGSEELARMLLDQEGIFFVPGSCFGKENYLRLGLGQKHENLSGVLERLESFMTERFS